MTETQDIRTVAAQRLVTMMELGHRSWRRRRMGSPWGDPRRGQGRVLALLKLKPETTQRELTFLLGVSKQSLGELLGKLEKQGFITREPSPEDRRVTIVRLTEAGAAEEQGSSEVSPEITELLEGFSDQEVEQFSDYLGRVSDRMEEKLDAEGEPEGPRGRGHGPWHPHGHGWGRGDFGGMGGRGRRDPRCRGERLERPEW